MTKESEDAEIDAYLKTLNASVKSQFERYKSRDKLLKEARRMVVPAPMPPSNQTEKTSGVVASVDASNCKRKRKVPLKPPTAKVKIARTLHSDSSESNATIKHAVRSATSMMSKEQRRLHEQAAAHFSAATKTLDKVGGGELRSLWKKRLSLSMHNGIMKEVKIPYMHNQSAEEAMNCRTAERGEPSTLLHARERTTSQSENEARIAGLRY